MAKTKNMAVKPKRKCAYCNREHKTPAVRVRYGVCEDCREARNAKKTYRIAATEGWLEEDSMEWMAQQDQGTLFTEWVPASCALARCIGFKCGTAPRILQYIDGELVAYCHSLDGKGRGEWCQVCSEDDDYDPEEYDEYDDDPQD
jgi:hypothetical protein